jgi:hypothetical protein
LGGVLQAGRRAGRQAHQACHHAHTQAGDAVSGVVCKFGRLIAAAILHTAAGRGE